jgi:cytochrome P450
MLLSFRRDPLLFLEDVRERYGDVAHFRFGFTNVYLLSHPTLIRDVLVTHHRNFIKSRALQRSRILLGNGLLTSEGEFHLRQRRMIQPSFHRERIAAYGLVMTEHAERLSGHWESGATVDMAAEMMRLTLGIAAKTLLGVDVGDEEADEISRALSDALLIADRLTHPFGAVLDRLPVPSTRRLLEARDELDATVHRIIDARRGGGSGSGDLLSTLLAAEDAEGDGTPMTNEQVRDEILTIFLAGHETTANALSWTWYLLSHHPEIDRRLHGEVSEVLGEGPATTADFARLTFTRSVITESMRLYPPAWTIGRQPIEDFYAGGHRIRRGSIVLMSPWVVHRDARFFAEPLTFDPDRWTPERASELQRLAYFPFGAGPRKCIGEGFAWMEMVLVMATLASRWRARLVPDHRVVPRPLLHRLDHVEHRQIHRDHHPADHHAHHHDHDRLQHRGERAHRRVHLVVVEVGDLGEHLVQAAGLLADVDHLHHHGGNTPDAFSGSEMVAPPAIEARAA